MYLKQICQFFYTGGPRVSDFQFFFGGIPRTIPHRNRVLGCQKYLKFRVGYLKLPLHSAVFQASSDYSAPVRCWIGLETEHTKFPKKTTGRRVPGGTGVLKAVALLNKKPEPRVQDPAELGTPVSILVIFFIIFFG